MTTPATADEDPFKFTAVIPSETKSFTTFFGSPTLGLEVTWEGLAATNTGTTEINLTMVQNLKSMMYIFGNGAETDQFY